MLKRLTSIYQEHCEVNKTIVASTNCENTLSLHANGCEDICSGLTLPKFHLLLYIKTFVGAESYFKKALAMTLEKKNGLKHCNVRLYSVTFPKLCLRMELKNSSRSLRMYGDMLSMTSNSQVTFDLGCQYKVIWEFQRESYSPFKGMDDTDRVAHLCNKLVQLQNTCSFQRLCCGLYRYSYAWFWDKRSFASQQHIESGLGMFQCTKLLFLLC